MEEIRNIVNRPKELFDIPYYFDIPEKPIKIDLAGSIGEFMSYDLFSLDGVQPLELRHMKKNGGIIESTPSKASMDIYKKEGVKFQIVFVVINVYGLKEVDGVLVGKPYNISLMPASKRGEVQTVSSELIEKYDFEMLANAPKMYRGFNPFNGAYGFFTMGFVDCSKIESDMLGFVHGLYALAVPFKHNEILSPLIPAIEKNGQVCKDYKKYRNDRYFKPFAKVKPRRVWGCDSPIELFLLQALDSMGLSPELQTTICEDGFTVPTLHKLWENQKARRRLKSITDADFYFPDEKLAIFCDSVAHHSSPEAKRKDSAIDEKLEKIGITSLRICGRDIATSPIECAKIVAKTLEQMK